MSQPLYDPELQWLVEYAAEMCGTPIAFVSQLGPTTQRLPARHGIEVEETPIELSFCTHTVKGEGLLEIPDATQDERSKDHPFITGPSHLRYYAGVPITGPDGVRASAFCVMDREPRTLSDLQRRTLALLARQVELRLEVAYAKDRIEAEQEARKRVQSEAAALAHCVTSGLDTGLAYLDTRRRYRFANDAYARRQGFDATDATGRAVGDDLPKSLLDEALQGHEASADGLRAIPDRDASGRVKGVVVQRAGGS